MTDVVETEETEITETETSRVPDVLASNPILADFANKYLEVVDLISEYNEGVLKAAKSEWTNAKLSEEGKKLARPDDPKVKPHAELKKFLVAMENAQEALNFARKDFFDAVANELGVVRDNVVERDLEKEADLKNKRTTATVIGTQLGQIASLTSDASAASAVSEFLKANELPAVGRNSSTSFGGEGGSKGAPRYRVSVKVEKNGVTLLDKGEGFTKTAAMLSKPEFGYERGKSLKAEDLRGAWEKAGNSGDNPKAVPEVVFEDNGLTYTLTYNG